MVTEVRNDLVKSVTDYEGETPLEVINNITSSYKPEDSVKKSVRKHVKESIKDKINNILNKENHQQIKKLKEELNHN